MASFFLPSLFGGGESVVPGWHDDLTDNHAGMFGREERNLDRARTQHKIAAGRKNDMIKCFQLLKDIERNMFDVIRCKYNLEAKAWST